MLSKVYMTGNGRRTKASFYILFIHSLAWRVYGYKKGAYYGYANLYASVHAHAQKGGEAERLSKPLTHQTLRQNL